MIHPDEKCLYLMNLLRDKKTDDLHRAVADMLLEWPRCTDHALNELVSEIRAWNEKSPEAKTLQDELEKELDRRPSEKAPSEQLTIIIPIFYKNNAKSRLRLGCFDLLMKSIAQQDYSGDVNVLVVDNASPNKEILHEILSRYPSISIIQNKNNQGYAQACNLGLKKALSTGSTIFLLVNDDVYLNSPFTLSEMARVAASDDSGAVGSRCAVPQGAGIIIREGVVGMEMPIDIPTPNPVSVPGSRPILFVDGCAMLLKKKHLDTIGFLDESYFMYYEETDCCVRLARKGFTNRICLNGRVTHCELGGGIFNASSGRFFVRSVLIFASKNLNGFKGRWVWPTWILKEFIRWTIQSVKNPYRSCTHSRLRIILSGIIGYIYGLFWRFKNYKG